jgi:hypothetical protein
VVGILMRDDQRGQALDAGRAKVRGDDSAARIGIVGIARTGIVEERVAVRLHDHREALSHVEHRHAERAR